MSARRPIRRRRTYAKTVFLLSRKTKTIPKPPPLRRKPRAPTINAARRHRALPQASQRLHRLANATSKTGLLKRAAIRGPFLLEHSEHENNRHAQVLETPQL